MLRMQIINQHGKPQICEKSVCVGQSSPGGGLQTLVFDPLFQQTDFQEEFVLMDFQTHYAFYLRTFAAVCHDIPSSAATETVIWVSSLLADVTLPSNLCALLLLWFGANE